MWVKFCYDPATPQMNFKPGADVEVPDEVVRRWQIIWELFYLIGEEMGQWKARGWRADTKALPPRDRYADYAGEPVAMVRQIRQ